MAHFFSGSYHVFLLSEILYSNKDFKCIKKCSERIIVSFQMNIEMNLNVLKQFRFKCNLQQIKCNFKQSLLAKVNYSKNDSIQM